MRINQLMKQVSTKAKQLITRLVIRCVMLVALIIMLMTIGLGMEEVNTPQRLVLYYISLTVSAVIVLAWTAITNHSKEKNPIHAIKIGILCSSISTGTLFILTELWSKVAESNIATMGTDNLTKVAGALFLIITVLIISGAWLLIEEKIKSKPQ